MAEIRASALRKSASTSSTSFVLLKHFDNDALDADLDSEDEFDDDTIGRGDDVTCKLVPIVECC